MKVFVQEALPTSGSASSQYYELSARRMAEAMALTLVQINGELTLPDFYLTISALPGGGKDWIDFAWEMYRSGIDVCRSVEAEISAAREDASGGFKGIVGELQKAIAYLSDPVVRDSVSPPYDFDRADLCQDDQPIQFYMMCPPEIIETWALVIKSLFTGAMILEARAPQAPRQTWILDECAQLKGFDLVTNMFSYGAGIGIRPWAIFPQVVQMDDFSRNARQIIQASASVQSYFGMRTWGSAKMVSDMRGVETLDYEDIAADGRRMLEGQKLISLVLSGGDPFETARQLDQLFFENSLYTKLRRPLQTPNEVLNMASDRHFIFADRLPGAIYAARAPYWKQRFMAGRFHPNPKHPPLDRVQVAGRFGMTWRPVIKEPVPDAFADYPQYRSGLWSYIGG